MYARVTTFEIDSLQIDPAQALERFEAVVLPVLHQQPGFKGLLVLETPAATGMLVSLWDTEADAQKGIETGYYDEQVAQFVMFMKQPPGRDHYEVVYSEGEIAAPAGASGDRHG
jgi:heme-degrading monooxygenase HmoA